MRHIVAVSLTEWLFSGQLRITKIGFISWHSSFNLLRAIQGVYPVNFLIRRLIKKELFLKNSEFFSIIQALKSKTGYKNLTYVLNWVFNSLINRKFIFRRDRLKTTRDDKDLQGHEEIVL